MVLYVSREEIISEAIIYFIQHERECYKEDLRTEEIGYNFVEIEEEVKELFNNGKGKYED